MNKMARITLDSQTAERLLQGRATADTLPPGLDRVAAVFEAARRSVTESHLPRLEDTVAAMSAAIGVEAIEPFRPRAASRSLRGKVAVGSVAGLFSLFGGLAAAGALPAPVQNTVSDVASHVDLHVPQKGHGHGHGNEAGTPAGKDDGKAGKDTTGPDNAGNSQQPDNHGACVSPVAQDHTSGSQVAAAAKSDCGKPAQSQNPTAGGGQANKPQTPAHGTPAPQSENHGRPQTVPSSTPHGQQDATPGSQGSTHGGGHS